MSLESSPSAGVDPNMRPLTFSSRAFGLSWGSDHPLSEFGAINFPGPYDVTVERADEVRPRPGGRPVNNGEVFTDGARFRFGEAVFDTYGTDRVSWSSPDSDVVPAAFYGTVAAILLAWRGFVPLHGSAVELDGQAVLIAGPSGAGKSTLCASLVRNGGRLISDDLSVLTLTPGGRLPVLLPGRRAIRLATGAGSRTKALHEAPRIDADHGVALAAMVLLQSSVVRTGPIEATNLLRKQMFRPRWMQALPYVKQRETTIFSAAQQIAIFDAPSATDRPDLSTEEKTAMVLARLSGLPSLTGDAIHRCSSRGAEEGTRSG